MAINFIITWKKYLFLFIICVCNSCRVTFKTIKSRVVMYRILKYSIRIPDTFFDICIYSRYFWIFGYSILFTKYRILLNTWMINTYSGKACDDIFTTYAHTTHEYINTHDTLEHTHTQAHFSCKRLWFLIIFSLSRL